MLEWLLVKIYGEEKYFLFVFIICVVDVYLKLNECLLMSTHNFQMKELDMI